MKQSLSLFFISTLGLLASATDVYLHPSSSRLTELSTDEANLVLAQYLGLERFQPLRNDGLTENLEAYFQELGDFVGKGQESVVILGVGEDEIADVLPETLSQKLTVDASPSSLLLQYVEQAEGVYTDISRSPSLSHTHPSSPEKPTRLLDIFSLHPTPESYAFLADFSSLASFLDDAVDYASDSTSYFGVFDLSSTLHNLTETFGRDSHEYETATNAVHAALQKTIAGPNLKLALFSIPTSELLHKPSPKRRAHSKRQEPPQSPLPPPLPHPVEPISGISTCYRDLDTCTNSTSSCSGHGSCISATKVGKTCFVCACEPTVLQTDRGRKTVEWAGDRCERKDVSKDFVLLAGTGVGLVLAVVGSVALLWGAGEQALPSVLTASAVPGSKRE